VTEQKKAALSAKKDLERANAQLEGQLAKSERSEERRSKFLESSLARSKESEKCARIMLEKEQLAAGALRLKLEGVNLRNGLVETEKAKVKELREEVSLTSNLSGCRSDPYSAIARKDQLGASLCQDR